MINVELSEAELALILNWAGCVEGSELGWLDEDRELQAKLQTVGRKRFVRHPSGERSLKVRIATSK